MSNRKRGYGENARKCRMQFMASRRERQEIEQLAKERGCSMSELLGVVVTSTLGQTQGEQS